MKKKSRPPCTVSPCMERVRLLAWTTFSFNIGTFNSRSLHPHADDERGGHALAQHDQPDVGQCALAGREHTVKLDLGATSAVRAINNVLEHAELVRLGHGIEKVEYARQLVKYTDECLRARQLRGGGRRGGGGGPTAFCATATRGLKILRATAARLGWRVSKSCKAARRSSAQGASGPSDEAASSRAFVSRLKMESNVITAQASDFVMGLDDWASEMATCLARLTLMRTAPLAGAKSPFSRSRIFS